MFKLKACLPDGVFTALAVSLLFGFFLFDARADHPFEGQDEDGTYLVANAEQLNEVRNYLGSDFRQISDIFLGEMADVEKQAGGWSPIGDEETPFTGNYDGDDYTIYGLQVDMATSSYAGLFGVAESAGFYNINIQVNGVFGWDYVGALVGLNDGGDIINCSVFSQELPRTAVINGPWQVTGNYNVGGLAGKNKNGAVESSSAMLFVTGERYIGGLIGRSSGSVDGSEVLTAPAIFSGPDTLLMAQVAGDKAVGGLVGLNHGKVSYSESRVPVQGTVYTGGLVGQNGPMPLNGMPDPVLALGNSELLAEISESYSSGYVWGESAIGGLVGYNSGGIISGSHASGDVAGSQESWSVGGLAGVNLGGEITGSSSAGDVTGGWLVGGLVGENVGFLEYANGVITGRINGDSELFAAVVKGCHSEGMVTGTDVVGGLIGFNYLASVSQSNSSGDVGGDTAIGGLVGVNGSPVFLGVLAMDYQQVSGSSEVSVCHSTGSVDGNVFVGGLVGFNSGIDFGFASERGVRELFNGALEHEVLIENSYSTGPVYGSDWVGGIAGVNAFAGINGCRRDGGKVEGGFSVGGIAGGNAFAVIKDSENTSEVVGGVFVGGVAGLNGISEVATGALNIEPLQGIAVITDSSNEGNVKGEIFVGGVAGSNSGFSEAPNSLTAAAGESGEEAVIASCLSSQGAEVTGLYLVGGLVGLNEHASILNSYSGSDVNGYVIVGGLAGASVDKSTISRSHSTGDVGMAEFNAKTQPSPEYFVFGGLVGLNGSHSSIFRSFSTGNVNGKIAVGGLIGVNSTDEEFFYVGVEGDFEAESLVSQSYSTGDVTGHEVIGGFAGANLGAGVISNCFSRGDVVVLLAGDFTGGGESSVPAGGFCGYNSESLIEYSYSTGRVELIYPDDTAGPLLLTENGFIGEDAEGEYESNFWDLETSGQDSTAGDATGKSTKKMKTRSTFTDAGWDFVNIWGINTDFNDGYPFFLWEHTPGEPETIPVDRISGGSDNCFIATAAFGSPDSLHVKALRDLRDGYLLTHSPGRLAVSLYYRYSPSMADVISRRPLLRTAVAFALLPVSAVAALIVAGYGAYILLISGALMIFLLAFKCGVKKTSGAHSALFIALVFSAGISSAYGANVNHFEPAPAEMQTVTTVTADTVGERMPAFDLFYSYGRRPLDMELADGNEYDLVKKKHKLLASVTYGISDSVQVSVRTPYAMRQRSDIDDVPTRGFGDTVLSAKYKLPWELEGIRFAVSPHYRFNTGRRRAFMSGEGPAAGLRLVSDVSINERWLAALNLGYEYRPVERLVQIDIEHSMLFGAAVAYNVPEVPLHFTGELFGRSEQLYTSTHTPIEALVSAGYDLGEMTLTAGAAHGLTDGYGASDWRFFTGLRVGF